MALTTAKNQQALNIMAKARPQRVMAQMAMARAFIYGYIQQAKNSFITKLKKANG